MKGWLNVATCVHCRKSIAYDPAAAEWYHISYGAACWSDDEASAQPAENVHYE